MNHSIHLMKWLAGELPEVGRKSKDVPFQVFLTQSSQDRIRFHNVTEAGQLSDGSRCIHAHPHSRQGPSFKLDFNLSTIQ